MTYINTNDIFDDLKEENKRLLYELLFADKCLKCLTEFKSFVDLVINKINNYLEVNDILKYREFCSTYETILNGMNLNILLIISFVYIFFYRKCWKYK